MNLYRLRSKASLVSIILFSITMGINVGMLPAIHLTPDSELLA
ncbi:MAG TPA: hypothetical protein VKM55_16035 [Candidatus Lokiarchaeia archaeon]|nr:hypothetical protein [Candidatus Lokiarchaeia archaeon]